MNKFLNFSPEKAVSVLAQSIEEGYELYDQIRFEYNSLPDEPARLAKLPDWQSSVHAYYHKCEQELTSIYSSSIYAHEFMDVELWEATSGEIRDFSILRRELRERIHTLRKDYDFIIQHSNASLTGGGDLILNLQAGRDIINASNGQVTTGTN